jgi:hypothetical protein
LSNIFDKVRRFRLSSARPEKPLPRHWAKNLIDAIR